MFVGGTDSESPRVAWRGLLVDSVWHSLITPSALPCHTQEGNRHSVTLEPECLALALVRRRGYPVCLDSLPGLCEDGYNTRICGVVLQSR